MNTPSRDVALDATRTVAIWLMVVCHVARLMPRRHRPDWFNFGMDIEPLCQGLFLGMVGVSMVYSKRIAFSRGNHGWATAQRRRALELYGLSVLFFLGQQGWQWPWVFINSGILLAIGLCILFFTPFIDRHWGLAKMTVLGLFICAISILLDINKWLIPLISTGNGVFLPHAMLTAFGACGALVLLDGNKATKWIFCIMGFIAGAISLLHLPFWDLFDYSFGRRSFEPLYWLGANGPDQMWTLLTGVEKEMAVGIEAMPKNWEEGKALSGKWCRTICAEPESSAVFKGCMDIGESAEGRNILCSELKRKRFGYYHYTPLLAPLLMALSMGIYLIFSTCRPLLEKLWPLWLVGKRSLGVYLLHLALVGATTILFGSQKPFKEGEAFQINLCFVMILATCYIYAAWRERKRIFK